MDTFLGQVRRIAETALCLLMTGLVALAFTQVVLRYVFNTSFFWAEEVILFAFTWIIFLASAVNLERGAHFGVDVLVNLFPRVVRRLIQGLMQLVIAAILGAFIWVGFRFAAGAWGQESDILRVPMTVLYVSLPIAACLMLLVVIRNLIALVGGRSLRAEGEDV